MTVIRSSSTGQSEKSVLSNVTNPAPKTSARAEPKSANASHLGLNSSKTKIAEPSFQSLRRLRAGLPLRNGRTNAQEPPIHTAKGYPPSPVGYAPAAFQQPAGPMGLQPMANGTLPIVTTNLMQALLMDAQAISNIVKEGAKGVLEASRSK